MNVLANIGFTETTLWGCGVDLAGSCKHCNEASGS
jgi:hypothetical protein